MKAGALIAAILCWSSAFGAMVQYGGDLPGPIVAPVILSLVAFPIIPVLLAAKWFGDL